MAREREIFSGGEFLDLLEEADDAWQLGNGENSKQCHSDANLPLIALVENS